MLIGQKLREIREAKKASQVEIAEATGLVQPYVSRVENGHTVPGVETLEKWASALKIPLYQILYDGEEPPKPLKLSGNHNSELWGNSRRQLHDLKRLRQSFEEFQKLVFLEADPKLVAHLMRSTGR